MSIEKLNTKLNQCLKRYDIVGATKIRAQITELQFDQEAENRKAAERIKASGVLERLQLLHSESYLLFSIASAKMDEAMELLEKNEIEFKNITVPYKEFAKSAYKYYAALDAAINKAEKAHLCSDYGTLMGKLRIVVEKHFNNPKNKKE